VSSGDEFVCEAYSAEVAHLARCFVAEPGQRVCRSAAECSEVMIRARKRIWRRAQEQAARGSEAARVLDEQFASPEHMLGGKFNRGGRDE
jgi:hypothetical protein